MDKNSIIQHKIVDLTALKRLVTMWKFKDDTVVFTNGCFDIFHQGHAYMLNTAATFGHRLVVAVNSDASIKKIKKPGRPIVDEKARAYVLASMHYVDAVVLFDDETPIELIKTLLPDVLVKGGDYKAHDIVGGDVVTKNGGRIEVVQLLPGYSTTSIEQKIIDDFAKT